MGKQSLTIHIQTDGSEPPSGVVMGDDRAPVAFAGWLDLMQAIERLVSGAAPERVSENGDLLHLSEAEAV